MNAWNAAEINDFRGPLDIASAATVLLDSENVVTGWSERAEDLFGYPAHEIIGEPLEKLLVGRSDKAPGLMELLGRSIDSRCRSEEHVGRHRDGHTFNVATTVCVLTDGESGPVRALVAAALEPLRSWEAHQAMLHGLATQSPIGLGLYDSDLRLTWTNATYEREIGQPLNEFAGKRVDELYAHGRVLSEGFPRTLVDVMRHVLETGESVLELLYQGRPPSDPEHDHVWSCAYYPLQDVNGQVLGVCEDALDITDRYRAEQRLALTVRAGVRIGTTLDMTTTAREVAEVVVPGFADTVIVDLADGVLEGEEPQPDPDHPPSLMRVVRRPAPADAGGEGAGSGEGAGGGEARGEGDPAPHPVRYAQGTPQFAALSSGEPVNVEGCPPRADGEHSILAVPLRARGTVMGLVTFLRSRNPSPFDNGELTLANELATRASLSIDNARRYTRERAASLTLQRNLLPHGLPEQSAVEIAHRYLPADVGLGVGGDFFDVIALSGSRVGLAVGDVVGHGVHAAATMGRLRSTVRALARMDLAPDELIAHLDDLALQAAAEEGTTPGSDEYAGLGMACLYMVYDPVSRRCTAARAGHPPPAYVDTDGNFSLLDIPPGPPLGVGGLPFESLEVSLPEGSLLALFTGGLVENRNRDIDAGVEVLRRVLTDREASLEELCDRALSELQPRGPVTEDAALLLARTRVLDSHHVADWELEASPSSAARARSLALSQLAEWGLETMAFTTELVVSELVTNAVRHASGPVCLRLIRDRSLLCEVSDTAHTAPNLRHSANDDEGGRGLFIVAQMVQRWGTRYTPSGKTLWTEQPLPREAEETDPA